MPGRARSVTHTVTSEHPRLVAALAASWRDGLPADVRVRARLPRLPDVGDQLPGLVVTEGLRAAMALVEADFRERHGVDPDLPLTHSLTLRTGRGNLTFRGQQVTGGVLSRLAPSAWRPKRLLASMPHMDADYARLHVRTELYMMSTGGPTAFFSGDYQVPRTRSPRLERYLHRWVGGLALLAQVQRRTSWQAEDDQLVQCTSLDIHRMSGIDLDPDRPRVFFRDALFLPSV